MGMTNESYRKTDSWAYWTVPAGLSKDASAKETQTAFHDSYQPGFPATIDKDDLTAKLSQVKYIFVGLNPGNAGPEPELFGNFHGQIRSADYRLAAAAYGTGAWGAFMTDLSGEIQSDSKQIKVTEANVQDLINHLDELGIPETAVLIAMGTKTFKGLEGKLPASHPLEQMYHYSNANSGHWDAETEHNKIQKIVEKHG